MARKYSTNIPLARDILNDTLKYLDCDGFTDAQKIAQIKTGIARALSHMEREVLHPAVSHPNAKLQRKDYEEVRRLHEQGWTQQDIAVRFKVNSGRVAEALREMSLRA